METNSQIVQSPFIGLDTEGIFRRSANAKTLKKVQSQFNAGKCMTFSPTVSLKGNAAYLKKIIIWMKMIHYPNTIKSHLVTIVPMAPFTPKSALKLRFALHIRYSIVIRRFSSHANTAQSQ